MPGSSKAGMTEARVIPWTYLLSFDLFLLSVLVLSTRFATFLHEVLGHGLTAAALGGAVSGIRVSLFGGGNAYYRFHTELGPIAWFAVAFGGILVNLLTGAFAMALANRSPQRGRAVVLSVFGIVSLWGGLAYASLGFYYGVGDPAASVREISRAGEWLWIPFLASAPPSAYFGVRSFLVSVRSWFPVYGFTEKILVLTLTLGVTGAIYAALYVSTEQRSVALETPSIAYQRSEERIRQEKTAEHERQLRESHPEWTEEELARALARITIEVRPEEVDRKPPLIPILVLAYLIGAILALRPAERFIPSRARISPLVTLSTVILAAATLTLLVATNGWLWRSS